MFDIQFTINGKSAIEAGIKSEFEKVVVGYAINTVKETISTTMTEAEARQITINVVVDDISNLSFDISGPEGMVNKVVATLEQNHT
jgi:hypothetical protein